MNTEKKAWMWLWLSLGIIVVDQAAKYFANQYLMLNEPLYISSFFNLTLRYNPGAAFGFLGTEAGWQMWLFALIALLVIVFLVYWLSRTRRSDWLLASALSLIIGGACGNLIDRIHLSYVIDYLDFHLGAWHFATFNFADLSISVGVILWVFKLIFFERSKHESHTC